MMELLKKIAPLHRTLACNATDQALRILAEHVPGSVIEGFPTSTRVWSWDIPKRWELDRASIRRKNGEVLVDADWNHLHVLNYSIAFSGVVSHDELMAHLHSHPGQPEAIPFSFSFYEPKWGFCVPHAWRERFVDEEYIVEIESRFEDGSLNVLSKLLPGESEQTFVICADICHPLQVNDSLTGVAAAVEIMHFLEVLPKRKYSYLLLVVPETIGSIAYLAHHPEVIENAVGGLFSEMLGTTGNLVGQRTRRGDTYWDRLLTAVLAESGCEHKVVDFMKSASNDEKVLDSPGVDIPTFSLTRYPYPEYHTSDDNIALIDADKLRESTAILRKVIEWAEYDYIPVLNQPGPVFLSGNGLFPDWRADPTLLPYWQSYVEVMNSLDNRHSLVQLATAKNIPLSHFRYWTEAFQGKGLMSTKPFHVNKPLAENL